MFAGLIAANNLRLRAAPGSLRNQLDGVERRWRWREYDLFAVEAGSGPFVLLVHGIYAGSSSYEFRRLFPLLARDHRVVAIDLLGNGASDRPNIEYNAELFVEQIIAAVDAFGDDGAAAIVGSSLGGAFSIRAAARLGDRVRALAVICPTGLNGALDRAHRPGGTQTTAAFRAPFVGETLFNMLAARPTLRWFLENQAYADPANITDDVIREYWLQTHQRGARYVPAHFVGGRLNCDVSVDLPRVSAPVLVVWGEDAVFPSPLRDAQAYVLSAKDGHLASFPGARLLPQEEQPVALAASLERFLATGVPA